jgi:hypothetical protein
LQNPAFADASIVPCQIDQKHEDAEADLAEGEAFKEAEEAKTMSSEKFRELSPESQNQFFREGGKIKED